MQCVILANYNYLGDCCVLNEQLFLYLLCIANFKHPFHVVCFVFVVVDLLVINSKYISILRCEFMFIGEEINTSVGLLLAIFEIFRILPRFAKQPVPLLNLMKFFFFNHFFPY